MANFDQVAGIYDFLKRVVFGNRIDDATSCFLKEIPPNARVLIIGGGTGEILKKFKSSHEITYLELSEAMILKAKTVVSTASVDFIQGDVLKWIPKHDFDYIMTPFVLDCFTATGLDLLLDRLKKSLKKEGKWIQTDFYPKNRMQKLLIKIMYVFFKLTANLNIDELVDFDSHFEKHQFNLKRKALFYHSMIESKIYHQID
ncbi:hypothetical protein MATR_06550 [Marivirga tractuosa]|uniref:Methyltransferase type 12 n=1 Tax=Marivirga tractuosa (strain ATCC 23168 / DSM 4126 / NBRC 15989 / NCIMB 1408 / VKM B-1430 / H-43) TaxID=643867 RepID=E4TRJ1_MARTH|nr:class I SAM-dependent methyltransferase [Marivirga tractuosa]ADR21712.1 Methyltransferase type 12 [Marivirga tractuosa DSM 4126]BDD13830.1 hypothetical protein MATR_06550 [Marivirga tractuosa]